MRHRFPSLLNLGFGLAVGALALISLSSIGAIQALFRAQADSYRTRVILHDAEVVLSELKDAQSAARGFVITGQESYLAPFLDSREIIATRLRRLRRNTRAEAPLAAFNALEPLVAERLDLTDHLIATRRRAGLEAARAEVVRGDGKRTMDEIRRRFAAFTSMEEALLESRERIAAAQGRWTINLSAWGGGLTILALLAAAVFIRRSTEKNRRLAAELEVQREQALQVKSDFINMASHELRTPLTAIKLGVDLVQDETIGPINADQRRFIDSVKRNVDRLVRLINDVLDFQKMDVGRFDFTMRPEDANAILREAAETFAPLAQSKGLRLVCEPSGEPLPVSCDKDKIIQVLANFISNALKFTASGSITVSAVRRPEGVKFLVKDQGPGISREDLGKLFRSFTQLEAGKKAGGTGLGLALAKGIIENHDGAIGAESGEGLGSTFHFTLPLNRGGSDGEKNIGRG